MSYTTLISTSELAQQIENPNWAIVDCRFALNDTKIGRQNYLESHIPGALYAHLDEDLSGPIVPGQTGRHPLPDIDTLSQTLSNWGIDEATQVVAYDDAGGLFAGRLWWMLRWLGHNQVAVLDGGWSHWQQEGHPTRSGLETGIPRFFVPHPRPELQVSVDEIVADLADPKFSLYDARDGARYRGEVQGMDPVAGHIPGARLAFFGDNLGEDGRFLSQEALRTKYQTLLGDSELNDVVFYCGSGVSAAHNLLAMQHAGIGEAKLYVGSWSDWINDSERPVETGEVT